MVDVIPKPKESMSTPISITDEQMDTIVYSTEHAVVLDCLSRKGEITYREAIRLYDERMASFIGLVNSVFGNSNSVQIKETK